MTMKKFYIIMSAVLIALSASAQPAETCPELARARELSEIDWTPLHDIQLCGKKDRVVKAMNPQHGMLYSSASENNKCVPYDVSLYTFLTCIHNPYSLLYTESRNPTYPRSAYGFEYHGIKTSGPWMGCVCSVFSSYVAGFEFSYVSSKHAQLCEDGILSRPENQSAQGVEPFDILWQEGHCRAVTGVTRADDGKVISVEVSESKSPVVVRRTFSAASFDSLMAAKQIVIYRRADMSRQGTPPVYHMPDTIEYNDAICTYAGDRACFKVGDRIIIHCFDRSYKAMELYRNGKLIQTVKLRSRMLVDNEQLGIRGNLDLDPGAYAVDLSEYNLTFGKYEACLVNGSKRSAPTRFEIIDGTVTYEDGKIFFSSNMAEPVIWKRSGNFYVIPAAGRARGWIKAKNVTAKSGVKVVFQGEYGRVTYSLEF